MTLIYHHEHLKPGGGAVRYRYPGAESEVRKIKNSKKERPRLAAGRAGNIGDDKT